jgi:ribosomal protein L24
MSAFFVVDPPQLERDDRVQVLSGLHRGELGTVLYVWHAGAEILLDDAGRTWFHRDDLELVVVL